MNNYYVYTHRKADTGEVFYVGKGKGKRAYKTYNRSRYWNNIVSKHGREVEIIVDNIDEELAFLIEIETIATLRSRGNVLCNMTNGGEGSSGCHPSSETREKIGSAQRGVAKPNSQKQKLSELLKSGTHPIFSAEARAKNAGENHWVYGRTSENNPSYGRKDTPEMVEAKRQRMLGRKMGACSEERKERIRQAKLGKKVEDTSKYHWERERITCPHCGKDGIVSNMNRWHFDNCKEVRHECIKVA